NRAAGRVVLRHLVLLPHRAISCVVAFTDVMFEDRPAGRVVLRHLILLPDRFTDCIPALAHVLFIDRLANRVFADDIVVFPYRLAHGVAAIAIALLVHRLAHRVAALLHNGVVDGAITNARLLFRHRAVTDAIADCEQTTLFRRAAHGRIARRAAVSRPHRSRDRPQAGGGRDQGKRQLEPHLGLLATQF